MKWLLSAVLAGVIAVGGMAASCVPAAYAAQGQAHRRSLSFADADVEVVAEEVLGRQLRVKFAVSPEVRATMTFQVDGLVSDPQLPAPFESALALSGAVLVLDDGQALIVPRERARAAAPKVNSAAAGAYRSGYTIRAVVLAYGTPTELTK